MLNNATTCFSLPLVLYVHCKDMSSTRRWWFVMSWESESV